MKRLSETQITQIEPEKPKIIIQDYMLKDPQIEGFPDVSYQDKIYNFILDGYFLNSLKDGSTVLEYECGRGDFGAYITTMQSANVVYNGFTSNEFKFELAKTKYDYLNIKYNNIDEFTILNLFRYDWVVNVWNFIINEHIINTNPEDFVYAEFENYLDECLNLSEIGTVMLLPLGKMDVILKVLRNNNLKFIIDKGIDGDFYKLIVFNN